MAGPVVAWKAMKGDYVSLVEPPEDSDFLVGDVFEVAFHNREEGWINVVHLGGELAFRDVRFVPCPKGVTHESGPTKNDHFKSRMDIVLGCRGIEHVGQVFRHGAKKYEEFNWRKGGNDPAFKHRMAAAALRHIASYLQGVKLDSESEEPHLAHAVSNLLMILDLEEGQ